MGLQFYSDSLQECYYKLSNSSNEVCGYLTEVYDGKYGPGNNKILDDGTKYREWILPDGTRIVVAATYENGSITCGALYMAPENQNPNGLDDTGI